MLTNATDHRDEWANVADRFRPAILQTTARILRNSDLAEDACQETQLHIIENASKFRVAPSTNNPVVIKLIRTIAFNTACSMLRKNMRSQHHEHAKADLHAYYYGLHYEMVTAPAETETFVRTMIDKAPQKFKALLDLRFNRGFSYAEIADELGCSTGAARSRGFRALKLLRKSWKQSPESAQ
jgi:RNA polymerase sigma factor (sigma-70 family)